MFLLALIGTHPSDAPIEALPQESVSYVPTHWPVRQTNHEIRGRPIVGTSDIGNHVQLIRVSVLAQHEVSTIDVVVDQTIGLRTGIRELLYRVAFAVQEALIKPHLRVMLVTKRAKFLARLGSRHRTSSETRPTDPPRRGCTSGNAGSVKSWN